MNISERDLSVACVKALEGGLDKKFEEAVMPASSKVASNSWRLGIS